MDLLINVSKTKYFITFYKEMHVYQYTVLVHFGAITDIHVSESTSGVNNNK